MEFGSPSEARAIITWALLRACGATEGILRMGLRAKDGGGGSRTRVREYIPVGLYMRVHFCFLGPT